MRRDGHYSYFSNAFRDFVRSQDVSDLIQISPFVVDVQQNAVLMNESPVDLTKTEFRLLLCLIETTGRGGNI